MYGCDLLFSEKTAEEVRTLVRTLPGGCRCEVGGHCPLIPKDVNGFLAERLPLPVAPEVA